MGGKANLSLMGRHHNYKERNNHEIIQEDEQPLGQ